MLKLVRTNSKNKDFIFLVKDLDAFLKIADGDEHDFYNQFNSIDALKHVVVAYLNKKPVACGAIKQLTKEHVELKRMFTNEATRGKGIATLVLKELEDWATELNYNTIVLETGTRQNEAVRFYKKNTYQIISNYGQYKDVENSLCFEKNIKK
ncbi:GNAT family N-acetyltransferase [Winogradskyella sp. UBA3174]|uniref:GNAT family N-acetyltransferase n=1 Tax=Winogradskyella sp. UBA3174 TaxID=1947785 RepID=UPI0025F0CE73|nr:GNAT family N-acetyltransferase [Winogradskyella sp. UBA3174]|tara:strand:+ start:32521 stop:32976 length:456 start_codon:yes stop_codon:yes gene_type:complete